MITAARFSAIDHCFYDGGGFTVVKRATSAYPAVFVLETLVQAARRALGAPDLVLARAEATGLRGLPAGGVLTLRPAITETADGCAVTAGGIALECVRDDRAASAYPAALALAAFADAAGAGEPLALRGVVAHGYARAGQVLEHIVDALPGGWVGGETRADGRPVLTVGGLRTGEATTG